MAIGYANTLVTGQSDGAALANTTTAASILPSAARLTLPGNSLSWIGQMFTVEAAGRISTVVTTPGTMTFSLVIGGITVASSPAFALNVVAKTNVTWRLRWDFTVRAVGNGTVANLMHTGEWMSEAVIGSPLPTVGGSEWLAIPASAPAVGSGFDSTADNIVDLFADWSIANAANSIQLHQYRLISWN